MEEGLRQIYWAKHQFNRALVRAEKALLNGHLESLAAWAQIAADLACHRHPGFYASRDIERLLLSAAERLRQDRNTIQTAAEFQPLKSHSGKRFLHVVTKTYATGGHTRVIERWVNNSPDDEVHSIIATSQDDAMPHLLVSSIKRTGGRCGSLANLGSLLKRGIVLRQIAMKHADVVVLHTHQFDVVPLLAFGTEGGPPVVLFNHAGHTFWLGASVADLVTDILPLSSELTRNRRGVLNSRILPIPLEIPTKGAKGEALRKKLAVPVEWTVLLTIGHHSKYVSFRGYDFLRTMVRILLRHPRTVLVAVGPASNDKVWKTASDSVGGRIIALGQRTDLATLYDSSDIYLPSFPVGGLTGLLDAGLHGIPIVGLSNREAPLLCGENELSLRGLRTHFESIPEYEGFLEKMINDAVFRRREGLKVKKKVTSIHTGVGWKDYLHHAVKHLPTEHHTSVPGRVDSEADASDVFLAGCDAMSWSNYTLPSVIAKHSKYLPKEQWPVAALETLSNLRSVLGVPPPLAMASLSRYVRNE